MSRPAPAYINFLGPIWMIVDAPAQSHGSPNAISTFWGADTLFPARRGGGDF